MKRFYFLLFLGGILLPDCNGKKEQAMKQDPVQPEVVENTISTDYIVDGFDFPVGKPDAKGYYNSQKFTENNHLGDDWNGVAGGNSDLGDPIYATANGFVKFAEDIGDGWGNVIRIEHTFPNNKKHESLYAHCDTVLIKTNSWVKKGAKIGTIGTANGQYYAHLHFEIRDNATMEVGGGYSENTEGYLDPTAFINANRKVKNLESFSVLMNCTNNDKTN